VWGSDASAQNHLVWAKDITILQRLMETLVLEMEILVSTTNQESKEMFCLDELQNARHLLPSALK